jgi:hypothetical protein
MIIWKFQTTNHFQIVHAYATPYNWVCINMQLCFYIIPHMQLHLSCKLIFMEINPSA